MTSLIHNFFTDFTGTPMNTVVKDLKNQLKFIGVDIDSWFDSLLDHKTEYDINALMYLLRPLMMRHSQRQRYTGTKTTLMSLPPKVRVTIRLFLNNPNLCLTVRSSCTHNLNLFE